MFRRMGRGRSGITLTEILISIMILGVGLVSLATLFPLGLLRLRDAARYTRSSYLSESAGADLEARNLLAKPSFLDPLTGSWYTTPGFVTPLPYDPWLQDTPAYMASPYGTPYGAYRGQGSYELANAMLARSNSPLLSAPPRIDGEGLPVAYDPLWRAMTPSPDPTGARFPKTGYFPGAPSEARFASGIGFVRNDPNGTNTSLPSAHGLQRITNFPYYFPFANYLGTYPYTNQALGSIGDYYLTSIVPDIFVSPEDVVLQSNKGTNGANLSPIVPEMVVPPGSVTNMPLPQSDWRFSWMFTGQQVDTTNSTEFHGDVVIFENRPFGIDDPQTVVVPFGGVSGVVTGETVVEAIFGYTNSVTTNGAGGTVGYGLAAPRTVLLRWSDKVPDPDVRTGSWIADVTYERNAAEDNQRTFVDPTSAGVPPNMPYQRCHWYRVAKRTPAGPDAALGQGFRSMTVWTDTPLKAYTLLSRTGSQVQPYHVNAALVSPYVVSVIHKRIFTR